MRLPWQNDIALLATSPYTENISQQLLLVVRDGQRARDILEVVGMKCESESVLLVKSAFHSRTLAILGTTLQNHGIGVHYAYLSTLSHRCLTGVFKTTDQNRALAVVQANYAAN
jgi:hypothetical protein